MGLELTAVRAVHFISTMMVGGVMVFECFVLAPAAHAGGGVALDSLRALRGQFNRIVWLNLALAVLSGAGWFLIVYRTVSGGPAWDVFIDPTAWLLLRQTQFGSDGLARLALVILIAVWLMHRREPDTAAGKAAAAVLACSLLGTLAWTGHAGATPGARGAIHLGADVIHLVAAGAWVGALLPLALLLALVRRQRDPAWLVIAGAAVRRFSTLGMTAVAAIFATGLVNTWALVGSVAALTASDYGRLLMLKIAGFAAMAGLAAFNRLVLMPRLDAVNAQRLERNALLEAALGLVVVVIVSVLGTLPPASHMPMPHLHRG